MRSRRRGRSAIPKHENHIQDTSHKSREVVLSSSYGLKYFLHNTVFLIFFSLFIDQFEHFKFNFVTYFFPTQSHVEVRNETVRGFTFQVCHLKPDTLYTFRLRHRVNNSRAPWSRWSNSWQGRTRESGERTASRDRHARLCLSDI